MAYSESELAELLDGLALRVHELHGGNIAHERAGITGLLSGAATLIRRDGVAESSLLRVAIKRALEASDHEGWDVSVAQGILRNALDEEEE